MKTAHCRFCDAVVIWADLRSGKKIPLDAEPGWAGRYEIEQGAKGEVFAVLVNSKPLVPNRHRNHLGTCARRPVRRKVGA